MKIVVMGQAAFGESVLNALVQNGECVVGVFCSPDKEGKPADPIKVAAEACGVEVFQFGRMRDAEALEAFRNLNADLGVMAFVTDIVPEDILQAPRLGTIQYHPSLLPKHRGPSSINWPIIQGEKETGLTIFWPDAGLDTGPMLLQKSVEIGPDDTLGSVYFGKLFSLGVEAMVESVGLVKEGAAPRLVQDESEATYEGWCRAKDCMVDWGRPVGEVYDLIRGADPSPGAGSCFGESSFQLYDASVTLGPVAENPGTVLSIGDDGLRVAGVGGSVLFGRVRPAGSGKLSAGDWAKECALNVGNRLGT